MSVPEPIHPGEQVTRQRLAEVSAADFYWAMLERQMTRPISQITEAYFRTPDRFVPHGSYDVNLLAIDHRGGDFAMESTSYQAGRVSTMDRCVDGKTYFRSAFNGKWGPSEIRPDCTSIPDYRLDAATDGIVASGLSSAKADKVVVSLRDTHKGFAHPKAPTLFTAAGKSYIRQVVDYTPVKLDDGHYWGTRIFTLAFEETGEDPDSWPWYTGLGPGEGRHVVYYIDPRTLLPVASIMRTTPVLDDAGRESTRHDQTQVFNYAYPKRLPVLTLDDTKPLTLTLPEGWRIPK